MSQDTSTQISSISVEADIDETICNTELTNVYTEKNNEKFIQSNIEKITIEFIQSQKIAWGCFYDFDRDGVYEIAEQHGGGIDGQTDYTIYKLYNGKYIEIGTIDACEGNNTDAFSLYYDNTNCKYFYIGYSFSSGKNDGETSVYKYTFEDEKITAYEIAYFHYKYTQEDLDENKVFIDISILCENNLNMSGYYLRNEINEAIGIVDYLSQYEKVEAVDLSPQWGWYDENLEEKVRNSLLS